MARLPRIVIPRYPLYDMTFTHHEATEQRARPPGPPGKSVGRGKLMHSDAFKAISAFHKSHPNEPIDLFGHSWGGPAALRLLNELEEAGIPVRSVNTFDPVSRLSKPDKQWFSNAIWKNFFPGWRDRSTVPDFVSGLGGCLLYTSDAADE